MALTFPPKPGQWFLSALVPPGGPVSPSSDFSDSQEVHSPIDLGPAFPPSHFFRVWPLTLSILPWQHPFLFFRSILRNTKPASLFLNAFSGSFSYTKHTVNIQMPIRKQILQPRKAPCWKSSLYKGSLGKLGYAVAVVTLTFTRVSVNKFTVVPLGWGEGKQRIQPSGENSDCPWRQPFWLLVNEVFGGWLVLSSCWDKIPNKGDWGRDRFTLVHSSGAFCPSCWGKRGWRRWWLSGTSAGRKQRRANVGTQFVSPF